MAQNKNPLIMGIVNVTPDSFSDGGQFFDVSRAAEHGFLLVKEGADILDIGGESTRPGAKPVSIVEEMDRVIPVIEVLAKEGVFISVDTRNASVMAEALKAGARMINDVSALTFDPNSIEIAKTADRICLMHMRGTPDEMQENTKYDDVVQDVFNYLASRIMACEAAGIPKNRLIIDPGIGFGKDTSGNLALLKHIDRFHGLGVDVMLGASRKRFISDICGDIEPRNRVFGSVASALWGVQKNVRYIRVHDVAATKQALTVYQAILESA